MGKYTFRCDDDFDLKIKHVKMKQHRSFNNITLTLWETYLHKLHTESSIFHDLLLDKQAEYVVNDILHTPSYAFILQKYPRKTVAENLTEVQK